MSVSVDLSPLLQAVVGCAAAIISVATPLVVTVIIQRLHLAGNSAAAQAITVAVQTAGGIAYNQLVAQSHDTASVNIKSAAIAAGVQHVMATVGDELKAQGVNQEAVAQMVTGELGKLLAKDPGVSAGPSAVVA